MAGITGRGTLPLTKVLPKVKISSVYYVGNILKQYLEFMSQISTLVKWNHDMASSHTTNNTTLYLEDLRLRTGMNYIAKENIPVKSPDISPMDFFGFGYLKQAQFHQKARMLNGFWKAVEEEWVKVTPEKFTEVFSAWKQ